MSNSPESVVQPKSSSNRLVALLLSIALFLLTLIWTTPLAIEWAIVDWLKKRGVTDAAIEDIELNPFTGEFSLSQLSVGQREGERFVVERLYLKLDYLPLFEHRVEVRSIQLKGVDLDLIMEANNQLTLGGLALPKSEAESATPVAESTADSPAWHFGLDRLMVDDIRLRTHLPKYQGNIQLNHLKVEQVASWLQHQVTSVEIDMLVDGAKVAITSKVAPFKPDPEWRGDVVIEAINFENYAELVKLAGIDELTGKLSADLYLDGKWQANEQLLLTFDGDLNLSKLQLKHSDIRLQQSSLVWRGNGVVHYPQLTPDKSLLALQSRLSLASLSLELPEKKIAFEQKNLQWEGKLQYQEDRQAVADGLRLEGGLVVESLTVIDQQADLKLASLERADLSGLVIDGLQSIQADQLSLKQLTALGDRQPSDEKEPQQLFAADDLVIEGIDFQQLNHLSLNQVDLHGMAVALIRNKKGEIKWLPTPTDTETAKNEVEGEEGEEVELQAEAEPLAEEALQNEQKLVLILNKFSITEDSSIQFQDASVEPAYEIALTPFQLIVEQLDMTKPDQATTLMVKAKIDKYSSLDINGTFNPFQQPLSTALKAQLNGVDLTSLSPYMVGSIGYDFRRGRLDSESTINIDHGKLDISNELQIAKLTIIEADPETAANFSKTLVMPLDAALGILRDSDDNIAFNLPVTGDISAPEFSLSGVVNLALTNALKSAAMSYVTNALQPLGTVLMVYDLLEKVTQVRFQPLEYNPGSSELEGDGSAYANKVATLLVDRQTLKLTLCGVSNSEDQQVVKTRLITESRLRAAEKGKKMTLDDAAKKLDKKAVKVALLEIAENRSRALKNHLMERGVAETRLFTCRPMIDLEEGAKARVELAL